MSNTIVPGSNQYPYNTIQGLIRYYLNRRVLLIRILNHITAQQRFLAPLVRQHQPGENPTILFLSSILKIRKIKAIQELYSITNLRIRLSEIENIPLIYFHQDYDYIF